MHSSLLLITARISLPPHRPCGINDAQIIILACSLRPLAIRPSVFEQRSAARAIEAEREKLRPTLTASFSMSRGQNRSALRLLDCCDLYVSLCVCVVRSCLSVLSAALAFSSQSRRIAAAAGLESTQAAERSGGEEEKELR